jgi:L,D-peptidoglycan transpeptidase YkuD (ErfK/YbiS/YcfS/YnhG family)
MLQVILFFLILLSAWADNPITNENQQLIIVTTESWDSTPAWIFRFIRLEDQSWKSHGDAVPAVIGKNGMGWGRGVHSEKDISFKTPIKEEGDGKAPAGIFQFGGSFGYDETKTPIKIPYQQLTSSIVCVDDSDSVYYNKIIDRKNITEPDWKSSEKMRRADELYRIGIVIEHNPHPAQKKTGSCIFLHVWNGPQSSTSGCTATHEHHVQSIQVWLNPQRKPLLIQLPWREYVRLKTQWRLPEIPKKFNIL